MYTRKLRDFLLYSQRFWMLHECISITAIISLFRCLCGGLACKWSAHTLPAEKHEPFLLSERGQNLKVKYKSIVWIKGIFVYHSAQRESGCCRTDFSRKNHIFVGMSTCLDQLMLRQDFNPVMKLLKNLKRPDCFVDFHLILANRWLFLFTTSWISQNRQLWRLRQCL